MGWLPRRISQRRPGGHENREDRRRVARPQRPCRRAPCGVRARQGLHLGVRFREWAPQMVAELRPSANAAATTPEALCTA